MVYETPVITDFGSIGDHTFDNPGQGDKAPNPLIQDKFCENSHSFGEDVCGS